MSDRVPRREVLRASALGVLAGLGGCEGVRSPETGEEGPEKSVSTGVTTTDSQVTAPVSGTLVDLAGRPVDGAVVQAFIPGRGPVAEVSTNGKGEFGLNTGGIPAWLQISAEGFLDQTRAVAPDAHPTVELTNEDTVVSLSFCGDTMFGRRFYRSDEEMDHTTISKETRLADHRVILRPIAPLLQTADLTSVNLETPLTTTKWRHPEKIYSFVSHPVAAQALADAGVDYAALGNNHAFDALVPGLEDTFSALDSAGLASSGAGLSSDEAWKPAVLTRRGLSIGFLSCTTVVEGWHDIDLTADTGAATTHTVTREDGETISFSGNVGAAWATEERLANRVGRLAERVDITVVQLHGGDEYRRTPTGKIRRLAEVAVHEGADLVICHHPHVTGGLDVRDSAVIAWSLGNFVFDQTRWQTFPSYVLTTHVGTQGVERAFVDPLLLDGFTPTGVVGKPRTNHHYRTAGLSSDEFVLFQNRLQYVRNHRHTLTTARRTFGPGLYTRDVGWPRAVVAGGSGIRFGRDRLYSGTFDNPTVNDQPHGELLWRLSGAQSSIGQALGEGDSGGIRLIREPNDDGSAGFETVSAVPISGPLTFAVRYRYGSEDGLELVLSWYGGPWGEPADLTRVSLDATGGEWAWDHRDVSPPEDMAYVGVSVRLAPPETETVTAKFDDIRLIEWDEGAEDGRQYDHLQIDGESTIEFVTVSRPRGTTEIAWSKFGE